MNSVQKDTILTLLKTDKMNGNYTNNYWFSYKDYLDPADGFTDFCCECLEGKHEYIVLIVNIVIHLLLLVGEIVAGISGGNVTGMVPVLRFPAGKGTASSWT